VDIARPVETVITLFDNPDNMKHWQPGLLSFEHLSGDPGTPGARSKLHYKMGKREIEMIETIISRNLPSDFSGTYEANGVKNIVKNEFVPIDEGNTRYTTYQEFQFSGFMKLMGWFMPGAFKKQSQKYMEQFRDYVEST
jgi:hypothetical protein